jgi:polyferredoxin
VSAADALLVVHFAIVVFIVGGLILTWAGALLGWGWVRNPWFRYAHLGAIVFVALEALIGMMCPLTIWEDALRGGARPDSFIGRWLQRLLYYRAPEWLFATLYVAWAAATLVTLRLVPPRARGSSPAK